jgi:hypothetical protein
MAYSKVKWESNDDKASPYFRPFEQEMYQTNAYPYGLYYRFHFNAF